jgi:hypothetical protein
LSLSQILEGGIWNVSHWPIFFVEWMYACWMNRRFSSLHPTLCVLTTYGWHIWRAQAGRELAEISRPNTQEPPIVIKVSWLVDTLHYIRVINTQTRSRRTLCSRHKQNDLPVFY